MKFLYVRKQKTTHFSVWMNALENAMHFRCAENIMIFIIFCFRHPKRTHLFKPCTLVHGWCVLL